MLLLYLHAPLGGAKVLTYSEKVYLKKSVKADSKHVTCHVQGEIDVSEKSNSKL